MILIGFAKIDFAQDFPLFKVEGTQITGLTPEREAKMVRAMAIFEKVMNDKDFQVELMKFPFEFDVPNDPNRNLTSAEVTEKLYQGQEHYKSGKDNTANLHWVIKRKARPIFSRHPAIGFGNPGEKEIFTYTWFFDQSNNLADLIGHIAHEWSHKVGFDHLFKPHSGRENTVPYAFGELVRRFALRHIE